MPFRHPVRSKAKSRAMHKDLLRIWESTEGISIRAQTNDPANRCINCLNPYHDVWSTLEKMFSSQSKAHIMQTRYQLATLKKGALLVADYFQKAQTLAHTLSSIEGLLRIQSLSHISLLVSALIMILW
jgi:hypothetical protein